MISRGSQSETNLIMRATGFRWPLTSSMTCTSLVGTFRESLQRLSRSGSRLRHFHAVICLDFLKPSAYHPQRGVEVLVSTPRWGFFQQQPLDGRFVYGSLIKGLVEQQADGSIGSRHARHASTNLPLNES